MTKKELFRILEQAAMHEPHLAKEIEKLARTAAAGADPVDDGLIQSFLSAYPDLSVHIRGHPAPAPQGRVFPVHKPFANEIRQRMKLAERNDNYRNWANALKAVPEYTLPIPTVDAGFIRSAKEIWAQHIYGNEPILQTLLRHCIEYSKTGKTTPILLLGEPGIGKTLVAKNYGRILRLPTSFISGPSAAAGRGLAGAPNLYLGAGVGGIVQSMIDHGAGNPVICIDEIEKACGGYGRFPDFQNELLSALDENNAAWFDNYLEIQVDASHIPFIFTANEKCLISPPLLDRMEVIGMERPTLEMMRGITKRFTLPKAMQAYDGGQVVFEERELDLLVDLLWDGGNHSCRAYQKAVDQLVSHAYLNALESGRMARVTERDVRNAVALGAENHRTKTIGFCA